MDFLRIAINSFKFGQKVGDKAVELATRPKAMPDDKAWARVVMKHVAHDGYVRGYVLSGGYHTLCEDVCLRLKDQKDPLVWGYGDIEFWAIAQAYADNVRGGSLGVVPFWVRDIDLERAQRDPQLLAFDAALRQQNMGAELYHHYMWVERGGQRYHPCSIKINWLLRNEIYHA